MAGAVKYENPSIRSYMYDPDRGILCLYPQSVGIFPTLVIYRLMSESPIKYKYLRLMTDWDHPYIAFWTVAFE